MRKPVSKFHAKMMAVEVRNLVKSAHGADDEAARRHLLGRAKSFVVKLRCGGWIKSFHGHHELNHLDALLACAEGREPKKRRR